MSIEKTKQDVNSINKSVMEIQKHLECSICLEMLSNPYSTKCNHQFCWECINNFIQRCGKKSTNKWFCPLCKSSVSRRSLTANPKLAEIINAVHGLKNAIVADTECTQDDTR
ncbi:E3 ubiquitin-protein ligase TRIM31-like [Actinia tenebrosa]|uniref:E3 ubiquitin-protein ligase TRIM31-like n=1 Tax=Actinia tenebrosa TaxID=6105 RepID=A0A6P8HFD9_ACTTE|nr:E3 ubiquitin-protein ligase TRIM31-like [Actinia tenebrosa]